MSRQVVSTRRDFELPIKITLEPDRNTGRLRLPTGDLTITGSTRDLSQTGIAFVVSSVRVKEYYIVGENRNLQAELELGKEKVKMVIVGQRYEQVGEHSSVAKYLVGAKIVKMSDEDREVYEHFVRYGRKQRKQRKAGSLQLGIDES